MAAGGLADAVRQTPGNQIHLLQRATAKHPPTTCREYINQTFQLLQEHLIQSKMAFFLPA
jgi:hypothetical protein